MRRFRFTIAHLLLTVVFCGVAFAALKAASELWAIGLFTLTIGILLFGILGIIYRGGTKRAFWVGFTVVGWGYLVLSLVPETQNHLAMTLLLRDLYGRVIETHPPIRFSPDGRTHPVADVSYLRLWSYPVSTNWEPLSRPNLLAFVGIGHSLLMLVFAYLGSVVARSLYASRAPRRGAVPEETLERVTEPIAP